MASNDRLSNIMNRISQTEPEDAPIAEAFEETDSLTLAEMNGKYSSFRPSNKPIPRIHIIKASGKVHTMYYSHIDPNSTFEGNKFTLTYIGAKHWEVSVEGHGPDMWRIYDYCTLGRWSYLREATREFGDKSETVLTKITIADVSPKYDG